MYVTRKNNNGVEKIITPPALFDVLSADFDYLKYSEYVININLDIDIDELLYEEGCGEQISEEEKRLLAEYEKKILELQRQFEEDYQKGKLQKNYTSLMKKAAKELIKVLEHLDEKEQSSAESIMRVELFLKGEIELRQLHPIDLIYLKPSQLGITGILYNNLRLHFSAFSTEYDILNKEMGQLYIEIKEKRKGKHL